MDRKVKSVKGYLLYFSNTNSKSMSAYTKSLEAGLQVAWAKELVLLNELKEMEARIEQLNAEKKNLARYVYHSRPALHYAWSVTYRQAELDIAKDLVVMSGRGDPEDLQVFAKRQRMDPPNLTQAVLTCPVTTRGTQTEETVLDLDTTLQVEVRIAPDRTLKQKLKTATKDQQNKIKAALRDQPKGTTAERVAIMNKVAMILNQPPPPKALVDLNDSE
jgi:septal ring factor EnvC (AmiA/AmiB activator)